VTLDLFLESFERFDRDAVEVALARNGVEAVAHTADGGEAQVEVDEGGIAFFVRTLTPELARIVFDVAQSARLAVLPADGTATALVTTGIPLPDELEAVHVRSARRLHDALQQSVTRRNGAARPA
jgi:hypothetical protein